ncbi:hypothetical protein IQ287_20730 [Burkholderia sp. R-69927]|uniref:hypothetical protein n=1 Tax=Paraburkholderia domus TaxID=2793075 RepID=UPI00191256C3|nr:hypothetical protein [Paraburkholderia domus]MBK5088393.1 hypothetical protein [Burkholderia sp. R-69927]MBK5122790.1 hypothetical protein [Burkholderia sp. R-69980]MBK5165342.1 hypothetical protein [Burkholderia sp. R-70211]MCI0152418.1 hypothetical protein [Paraburkholderia sediminicola]
MPLTLGIALTCVAAIVVVGALIFGWTRYNFEVRLMFSDRYSMAILVSTLGGLYMLLIAVRMIFEPQYGWYVWGRFQESVYLRRWWLVCSPFFPFITTSFGYVKTGWIEPANISAWCAFIFSVFQFIKHVTGAWLRPARRGKYFVYEPTDHNDPLIATASIRKFSIIGGDILQKLGPHTFVTPGSDYFVLHGCVFHRPTNLLLQDPRSAISCAAIRRVKDYELPETLKIYRIIAFIYTRSSGGLLYNENKIGLKTDLESIANIPPKQAEICISKTTYFDFICSNDLTRYYILPSDTRAGIGEDLFDLVRSRTTGRVISLANSSLSNHMGGGTLAIARSGQLYLSKQGKLTLAARGLLAPTGSGSFDWRDQWFKRNLHQLIVTGIERELREECAYTKKDIEETIILGYGRDIRRGGKPDFFAVSFVNKPPEIDHAEIGFIDQHQVFDIESTDETDLREKLNLIRDSIAGSASKAVLINLQLLADAESPILIKILEFIRRDAPPTPKRSLLSRVFNRARCGKS